MISATKCSQQLGLETAEATRMEILHMAPVAGKNVVEISAPAIREFCPPMNSSFEALGAG